MDELDWEILRLLQQEWTTSRVAEVLHISQPAIVYRLNRMEKKFNRTLFIRNNKGIKLNKYGLALLSYTNHMMDSWEQLNIAMRSDNPTDSGNIKVGCPENFFKINLIHILEEFSCLYPLIRINVCCYDSSTLESKLKSGEMPICFIRGSANNLSALGYVQNKLFEDPYYIISSKPITKDNLLNTPFILNHKDIFVPPIIEKMEQFYFRQSILNSPLSITGDSQCVLSAVQSGFGWSIISKSRITNSENLYSEQLYTQSNTEYKLSSYICYQKSLSTLLPYSIFISYINNAFK